LLLQAVEVVVALHQVQGRGFLVVLVAVVLNIGQFQSVLLA
jgi:hypothetical protein